MTTHIHGVILAAGSSTRMQQNKLILPWKSHTIIEEVIDTVLASKLSTIALVTNKDIPAKMNDTCKVNQAPLGHVVHRSTDTQTSNNWFPRSSVGSHRITSKCIPTEDRGNEMIKALSIVPNENADNGQTTSLICGLNAAPENTDGVMYILGDMPLITTDLINWLINAFTQSPDKWIIPIHNGQRGNPVIMPRQLFKDIQNLTGDTGARPLMKTHEHLIEFVDCGASAIHIDINTEIDYEKHKR